MNNIHPAAAYVDVLPTSLINGSSRIPALRDLRGVVSRTVSAARAMGRDYMAQNHAAALAVISVRPEMSTREALNAVTRLRDLGDA